MNKNVSLNDTDMLIRNLQSFTSTPQLLCVFISQLALHETYIDYLDGFCRKDIRINYEVYEKEARAFVSKIKDSSTLDDDMNDKLFETLQAMLGKQIFDYSVIDLISKIIEQDKHAPFDAAKSCISILHYIWVKRAMEKSRNRESIEHLREYIEKQYDFVPSFNVYGFKGYAYLSANCVKSSFGITNELFDDIVHSSIFTKSSFRLAFFYNDYCKDFNSFYFYMFRQISMSNPGSIDYRFYTDETGDKALPVGIALSVFSKYGSTDILGRNFRTTLDLYYLTMFMKLCLRYYNMSFKSDYGLQIFIDFISKSFSQQYVSKFLKDLDYFMKINGQDENSSFVSVEDKEDEDEMLDETSDMDSDDTSDADSEDGTESDSGDDDSDDAGENPDSADQSKDANQEDANDLSSKLFVLIRNKTLDDVSYREEVCNIIGKILKNPPSGINEYQLRFLQYYKDYWIGLMSIETTEFILDYFFKNTKQNTE